MSAAQRIAAFAALAVVAFAIAVGIGRAVGPIDEQDAAADHGHDADRTVLSPVDKDEQPVLVLDRTAYDAGRQRLAFALRDAAGRPITDYEVQHEKLLHLVVVRRDLGGYRHVHPTLDTASGRWTVPLDLTAGTWRVYADFKPTGGAASLAEADLSVAGDFEPTELGPNADTVTTDGFTVHLARDGGELALHVQRNGVDVTDLERYLGAYGHLVAIRAEDLSYLHVHPQEGEPGPEVAFHAALDEPGRYRLFFEFQHAGTVHRAEFTVTVSADGDSAGSGEMEDMSEMEEESGGHGDH